MLSQVGRTSLCILESNSNATFLEIHKNLEKLLKLQEIVVY